MLRIKQHSFYEHFPDLKPVPGEPFVDLYDTTAEDFYTPYKGDHAVAFLLEPRSLAPEQYRYVQMYPYEFRLILTHDSKLLKLPNAKPFNWATVWCRTDSEKTKGISLVSSWKDWCPLHKERLKLAQMFDGSLLVDCFGNFRDGEHDKMDPPELAHEHYRFGIAIENDIDNFWFTEKILNCFANKVVPIYLGSPVIGEFFNANGIIQVRSADEIPVIVQRLDVVREYEKRIDAINDNFERSKRWDIRWEDRLLVEYGQILEEVQNG